MGWHDCRKVFISYGHAGDQVTALRLQALAAVHGLTVYVPLAFTRQKEPVVLDPDSLPKAEQGGRRSRRGWNASDGGCRQELNTGMALRKTMIVMAYPSSAP